MCVDNAPDIYIIMMLASLTLSPNYFLPFTFRIFWEASYVLLCMNLEKDRVATVLTVSLADFIDFWKHFSIP